MSGGSSHSKSVSRATSGRAASDHSDADTLVAGGQEEEEVPTETCHGCDIEDDLTNLPECHAAKYFHSKCWAAHRGYLRAVRDNAVAIAKHKHDMVHNPSQFRKNIERFVPGGTSRKAARHTTRKELFEESSTHKYTADENMNDVMLLPKQHFCSHVEFWDKMPVEKAEPLWEELHRQQEGAHDKGDLKRVAWQGIERTRTRSGQEQREGVRKREEASESNYEIKRRRLTAKTNSAPASSLARPMSFQAAAAPTAATALAKPGAAKRDSRSKPPANRKHIDSAVRQIAPHDLNDTEKLQREQLMADSCEKVIEEISGPNGMLTQMEKYFKTLPAPHNGRPDDKSEVIMKSLRTCKAKQNELMTGIEDIALENMLKMETDIMAATTHTEGIVKKGKDRLDALKFKTVQEKTKKRKTYLHDRHIITKYKGWMTTSGFPSQLAAVLASRMFSMGIMDATQDDVVYCSDKDYEMNTMKDATEICVWNKDSDAQVPKSVKAVTKSLVDAGVVKSCSEKADATMLKMKKWPGCLQPIEGSPLQDLAIKAANDSMITWNKEGSEPYFLSSKKLKFRFGPSGFPMVGCASLVEIVSGLWLVTCVGMDKLSKLGIVLSDFESFAKTESGASFAQEHCLTFRMEPGMVMWLPMGYAPLMTVCDAGKNEVGIAHCLVYSVLSKELAVATEKSVVDNTFSVNEGWLTGKKEDVWKGMLAKLTTYKQAVHA